MRPSTVKTINGLLVSSNGLPVDPNKSLPVDCGATGVVGQDCWGMPDGLLNFKTGMMSSDGGIATAKYLIRCALPATDTVGFVDYTGSVVRMKGEIGLAPSFKTGSCDAACQENISGCLMALTNGAGVHVDVELSSTTNALGGGHSAAFPYQEAVFYGNIVTSRRSRTSASARTTPLLHGREPTPDPARPSARRS